MNNICGSPPAKLCVILLTHTPGQILAYLRFTAKLMNSVWKAFVEIINIDKNRERAESFLLISTYEDGCGRF